jgi:hypothetical protein
MAMLRVFSSAISASDIATQMTSSCCLLGGLSLSILLNLKFEKITTHVNILQIDNTIEPCGDGNPAMTKRGGDASTSPSAAICKQTSTDSDRHMYEYIDCFADSGTCGTADVIIDWSGGMSDSGHAPAFGAGAINLPAYENLEIVIGEPLTGCGALTNANAAGKIVLMQRGACPFVEKTINAQNAGAAASIIYNGDGEGDTVITMGGDSTDITIASISMSNTEGALLNAAITAAVASGTTETVSFRCDVLVNSGRDLPVETAALTTSDRETSLADCASQCAGYQYMGLQGTAQCFCGNSYGSHGSAECPDDCGLPISGTGCGYRNAVYRISDDGKFFALEIDLYGCTSGICLPV